MRRGNDYALAVFAAGVGAAALLAAAYLPVFMGQVWAFLWAPEWQPAGVEAVFTRSLAGGTRWVDLMAVPVAAALIGLVTVLVASVLVLRGREFTRAR